MMSQLARVMFDSLLGVSVAFAVLLAPAGCSTSGEAVHGDVEESIDLAVNDLVESVSDLPVLEDTYDTPSDGGCIALPFSIVELSVLQSVETLSWPRLFRNEADYVSVFGGLNAGVNFDTQMAIGFVQYGSFGGLGAQLRIDSVELCEDGRGGVGLLLETTRLLPSGCDTQSYQPIVYSLIVLDARADNVLDCCSIMEIGGSLLCVETGADVGTTCVRGALCQPGLICAGLTRTDEGVCVADEGHHAIASNDSVFEIPDAVPLGVTSSVELAGLYGVDADIILSLFVVHPWPPELVVTLTDPQGRERVLAEYQEHMGTVVTEFSTPAQVNGTWKLHLVDTVVGNVGTINGWSVEVVTR